MIKLGVAILAATMTVLVAEFLRHRTRRLAVQGWAALAALLAAEWLMFRKIEPVATYFTPIAWTCWIFLADAMVQAVRRSKGPGARGEVEKTQARASGTPFLWSGKATREKLWMAAVSVPLWLIFEAYNLRLANWTYVGLPENLAARWLGYGWSFATITPAIFVTADLVQSYGWFARPARAVKWQPGTLRGMTVAGALMLALPLVTPMPAAAYLFALVWLGFIFLLEPVNYRLGWPSLLGDLAEGRRARLYSLLVSGWVCGWLWEFWNWWAAAKWLYIFPMFQQWKIFEMPAPGYLGFPPFALECYAMYMVVAGLIERSKGTKQSAAKGSR